MRYIFIFFSYSFYGQVLHHQMLSSQGASHELSSGITVTQTIGQQSLIGNSSTDFVVMQGFQQSLWGKYIASTTIEDLSGIKTTTYPNPFTETVNFQFSESVADVVTISVFDIVGRLVYQQDKTPINNILTINLAMLSGTKYLVQLQTLKLTYYTQIIKK
ncbi:MAG: hypothetical protein ACI87N_001596 [Flavobacteriales bacterium]|jgi:hypothetical protein